MHQRIVQYSDMDTNARWAIVIQKAEYLKITAFESRIGPIAIPYCQMLQQTLYITNDD